MAKGEPGIREKITELAADEKAKAEKKLKAVKKDGKKTNFTPFVAEIILSETFDDEFGLDPAQISEKTPENVPELKESGTLDGGKVGDFDDFLKAAASEIPAESAAPSPEPEDEEPPAKQKSLPGQQFDEYKFPNLEDFSVSELLELLKRVKGRLPATKLKDLDLEEELVMHFLNLKELMTLTLYDEDVPANQKAQIANSCAGLLQQMTKSQASIYSAEKVKRMEVALLKALHGMPQDVLEAFLDRYEKVYQGDEYAA